MWYSVKFDKKNCVQTVPSAAFKHPNKAPHSFSSSLKYKYFSIQYVVNKKGEPVYEKATILGISDTRDGISKIKERRISTAPKHLMETETELEETVEGEIRENSKVTPKCQSSENLKALAKARKPTIEVGSASSSKKMKLICEQAESYLQAVTSNVACPSSIPNSPEQPSKEIVPSTTKCVKDMKPKRTTPLTLPKVQKRKVKKPSKIHKKQIAQGIRQKPLSNLPTVDSSSTTETSAGVKAATAEVVNTPEKTVVSEIEMECEKRILQKSLLKVN